MKPTKKKKKRRAGEMNSNRKMEHREHRVFIVVMMVMMLAILSIFAKAQENGKEKEKGSGNGKESVGKGVATGTFTPTPEQLKDLRIAQLEVNTANEEYQLKVDRLMANQPETMMVTVKAQAMGTVCQKVIEANKWPAYVRCDPTVVPVKFCNPTGPNNTCPVEEGEGKKEGKASPGKGMGMGTDSTPKK
jgi:hypothetical protein